MYPTAAQPAAGVFVHRQAAALRELGVRVDVEVVSMHRGAKDYLLARPRIARAIRRLQPDVVHIHFGYTFLAVPAIAPRVVTYYGDDLNGASTGRGGISLKSRIGREVSRLAARRSEATIVVSEPMLRWLPPSTRSRAEVVRDSIDPRDFSPGNRRLARQRLGIAADQVVVLFPHSLAQPTKRVDLARAAVQGFTAAQPRAHLLVVNGAPPQAMPDYYRAADALIVTSDLEGGPTSVKEALACGLPVVSVPVGDQQVLREAGLAAMVAERDPRALARALEVMLSRNVDRTVSHLPRELHLDAAARRIVAVYERAIERRGARRSRERPRGAT